MLGYIALAIGAGTIVIKGVGGLITHRRDPDGSKRKRAASIKEARKARIAAGFVRRRREMQLEHERWRDGDQQSQPYNYKVGQHANEALAIRYGIANQERRVKEYVYYAKGGEERRNPDRDKIYFEPAKSIKVRKTRKIRDNVYAVELSDYRNRPAIAVIEVGTEYIKTFLPLDEARWFEEQADLELTLKGNGTFSLKELARFHVDKAVG